MSKSILTFESVMLFGKKRNGFSLVELIVAIAILGMLMSIAILAATRWLDKLEKDYYSSLNKNIVLVGQSYVQDNRNALPKVIGRSTKIPLKRLKDKKYLTSEVVDYGKKACDLDESYVRIFKYSENDYSYMTYLVCPNYTSKKETYANGPEIEIDFNNDVNVAKAEVTMTDPDKIISYSYIVYKDGVEVKNTGTVSAKLKREVKVTISLKKYVPSKIKITVVATDIYGNVSKKSQTKELKDTIPPLCKDIIGSSKKWTTGERKITVSCSDDGVGCERESYSKTFKTNTKEGTITIKDKSGNSTECKVDVYIDKDTPSIPTSKIRYDSSSGNIKTDTNWTNKTLWWGNFSSSSYSGIDHYEYSEDCKKKTGNITSGTSYQNDMDKSYCLRAVNKAGTASGWSNASIFKIDKTKPTCNVSGGSNNWTADDVTIIGKCSDSGRGCKKTEVSKKINTTTNDAISPGTIQDNAGNTTSCATQTVKVDKNAPTCTSSGGNNAWTNGSRTLTGKCSDSGSGCNKDASYTITLETNSTDVSPGTVCDNVGHCTTCPADQTVKIDKTKPTCNVYVYTVYYPAGSDTQSVNRKVTCSDTGGSDCVKTTYQDDKRTEFGELKSTVTEVFDNAGNKATCVTTSSKLYEAYYKNDYGGYYKTLEDAFNKTSRGTIYLTADLTDGSNPELKNKEVTLNLQGHTLTLSSKRIYVKENSTLNINSKGTIQTTSTANSGPRNTIMVDGTLNLSQGTIVHSAQHTSQNARRNYNSAVYVREEGTFNMSGGTLRSGSNRSKYSRGVSVYQGRFNMTGGTISSTSTGDLGGSGVVLSGNNARFHMTGGSISISKATDDRCIICANDQSRVRVHGNSRIRLTVSNGNKNQASYGVWNDQTSHVCISGKVSLSCTNIRSCLNGQNGKPLYYQNGSVAISANNAGRTSNTSTINRACADTYF